MLPDIKLKSFYLQFIHDAKIDMYKYNDDIKNIRILKEELYKYINENKKLVYERFKINLDVITLEWVNKTYNNREYLYNTATILLKSADDYSNRSLLLQIIKYCNILRKEHRLNKLIELTSKRKDIKFGEYRKYVAKYYNRVHKCVLQGMGYKYQYGIGTYVINHWKVEPKTNKTRVYLDYAATNTKKKELLSKGLKPYDEKEATWYKSRNIPYDGIEYRVYQNTSDWYEFTFINSTVCHSTNLEYKRTEYIASKYRGMSYKQMADDLCKTDEDIYNLQVDIKYKLNIILYKDPTKYLNYVRNAEQNKYMPGAHNSKNR